MGRKLKRVNSFAVRCGEIKVTNVKSVKYLGLQRDNDLSGKRGLEDIIKKCNTRLKFLYRYNDMLNLEVRKTLRTALIQCSFDYSYCSWYPGINKTFKKKLHVMQNKMVRFILKLESRARIGDDELVKAGFLSVVDRVKQLKLGHVFKIKNKSCPIYLRENFLKLDENTHRRKTILE